MLSIGFLLRYYDIDVLTFLVFALDLTFSGSLHCAGIPQLCVIAM